MKKNFNKKNNRKSGFTLMETMVAIFIIMLAITGPMVFTQNALRAAFLSRDQITAFFLAQDAIEYIKNIRDGHVVDIIKSPIDGPGGWLGQQQNGDVGNLIQYCMIDGECTIDTREDESTGIKTCEGGDTTVPGCVGTDLNDYEPLNFKDDSYFTNKLTTEGNIKPSLFSREIQLKEIQADKEVEVTVIIRWKSHEGVGIREVVVKENIYNWANALLSQSSI